MTRISLNDGDTRLLIAEGKKAELLRNQLANGLAQIRWETAETMKPIREYGGETYLKTKKYYPYVGMGYIQLTWEYNYEKAGKILGVDFVKNPKLLLRPDYAAKIAILGMRDGWFTGKKLSDYMTLKRSDFFNARSIVNGDKTKTIKGSNPPVKIGERIADWSKQYDAALLLDGYGRIAEPPVDTTTAKPDNAPVGFWAWLKSLFSKTEK